jgi:prepilin-type N-terminal cleavage/methylation domain-containing protein
MNITRPAFRPIDGGFTLLEMVCVLGVLAILAAVVSVNAVRRAKEADIQNEELMLEKIANGYRSYIMREKSVPVGTNWYIVVAQELGMSTNNLLFNKVKNPRFFMPETYSTIVSTTTGANSITHYLAQITGGWNASPAYVQNKWGARKLDDLRVVFASSLSVGWLTVDGNFNAESTYYERIWANTPNSIPDTPDFNLMKSKGLKPEDLILYRITLTNLFCRVILTDIDAALQPQYSLEGSTSALLCQTNAWPSNPYDTFFIKGTRIDLRYPDGTIQFSDEITDDVSYVFEKGRWGRRTIYGTSANTVGPYSSLIQRYLATKAFCSSHNDGMSYPQDYVDQLYVFLTTYCDWNMQPDTNHLSWDGFGANGSSGPNSSPKENVVFDTAVQLSTLAGNTVTK